MNDAIHDLLVDQGSRWRERLDADPYLHEILTSQHRQRVRRFPAILAAATAVLVIAATVALVSRLNTTDRRPVGSASRNVTWQRSSGGGISVSHPVTWRAYHFVEESSFSTALLFLATRPVPSPCTTTTSRQSEEIACSGLPKVQMRAGDVLIGWFSTGRPETGEEALARSRGTVTRVNGAPAKIFIGSPDADCRQQGGTQTVTAAVGTGSNSILAMTACLAHPSAAQTQQVVRSVRSLRT